MNKIYDLSNKRVWVAGHRGLVGSTLVKALESQNCTILTAGREEVDLRRQEPVEKWLKENQPDAVFIAAATVGGIMANSTRPAEFLCDNLQIETNIIHGSYLASVEKLMFLGSACIYPREAEQPMPEHALLTGPLEPTNEWYAIAKIAGIKLCAAYRRQYGCDFISAMPNNLFGPGDNFDLESSHVVPALIRKMHKAKTDNAEFLEIWGTGSPMREFLYSGDCADALIFLMERYSDEPHINIGSGEEFSIRQLAEIIRDEVGFSGELKFDTSKPDGMPRKLVDPTLLLEMGWQSTTTLNEGIRLTYDWMLKNVDGI